jgi:YidC/Oxa1 family membrane protein insertase
MEKRALVAFTLSLAVLVLWEVFVTPELSWFKRPESPVTPPAQTDSSPQPPPPASPPPPGRPPTALPAPPGAAQEQWHVNAPLYKAEIVASGARINVFKLKRYRESVQSDAPLMELVAAQRSGYLPLAVDFVQHADWEFATRAYRSGAPAEVALESGQDVRVDFVAEIPGRFRVTKAFTFAPDGYAVDMEILLQNLSGESFTDQVGVSFYFSPYGSGPESSYNKSLLTVFQDRKLETLELKDIIKKGKPFAAPVQWVGYQNNYFLSGVIPLEPEGYQFVPKVVDEAGGLLQVVYLTDPLRLEGGQEKSIRLKLYLGPKELAELKRAGHDLSNAVDYGWFDFLAKPLLYVLKLLYDYTHNYGVAIIILTVIIKILFWPLTHKSYQSMQAMKKLQPKMAKIREKYKDDREKLNEEMMALYRTYKVNPLGGCLPMVLQIPVFFALYRMLNGAVELLHQPFFLWMDDLTAPDRLNVGFSIPYLGGLPVLTILMGATMFIQQKMTPTTGDPRQEKLMLMMPVIFTVMFVNFPSGLVLYWLVNNVLSIAQQYWINRQAQ